jgi:hypothetical protein
VLCACRCLRTNGRLWRARADARLGLRGRSKDELTGSFRTIRGSPWRRRGGEEQGKRKRQVGRKCPTPRGGAGARSLVRGDEKHAGLTHGCLRGVGAVRRAGRAQCQGAGRRGLGAAPPTLEHRAVPPLVQSRCRALPRARHLRCSDCNRLEAGNERARESREPRAGLPARRLTALARSLSRVDLGAPFLVHGGARDAPAGERRSRPLCSPPPTLALRRRRVVSARSARALRCAPLCFAVRSSPHPHSHQARAGPAAAAGPWRPAARAAAPAAAGDGRLPGDDAAAAVDGHASGHAGPPARCAPHSHCADFARCALQLAARRVRRQGALPTAHRSC